MGLEFVCVIQFNKEQCSVSADPWMTFLDLKKLHIQVCRAFAASSANIFSLTGNQY